MKTHRYVLVLNSGNPMRLPHLQKLYELRNEYEFCLLLDSRSEPGWQRNFIDRILPVNLKELNAQFHSLTQSIADWSTPDAILNLSEFCVPLHVKLAQYYDLPGPGEEAAVFGRNKYRMRQFLSSLGIPVPRFTHLSRATLSRADALQFPVVIKPAAGGGSTLVRRCDSFAELASIADAMEETIVRLYASDPASDESQYPFVAEEIIGGDLLFDTLFPYTIGEISVESVFVGSETHILAIHDKPLPANGPHFEEFMWSTPTRIPESLRSLANSYVDKIHRALGAGAFVLHTEFRTFKDHLIPLEFGVRMGGAVIYRSVALSTGQDFLDILLALGLGKTPEISTREAIPTLSHSLWAAKSGTITAIRGEPLLMQSPNYVEHQLYDDVGQKALRAPLSSRCNGHVIYQSKEGHGSLEAAMMRALDQFEIEVNGERSVGLALNRI